MWPRAAGSLWTAPGESGKGQMDRPEATAQPGCLGMGTQRGWPGRRKHEGLLPCLATITLFRHPILYQEVLLLVKPREKQDSNQSQRATCQGSRPASPPPTKPPPQAQSR